MTPALHVFPAELDAGIGHLVRSSGCICYAAPVLPADPAKLTQAAVAYVRAHAPAEVK